MILLLALVLVNVLFGECSSVMGDRLVLSKHPLVVRIRYLGYGMVLTLFLSKYLSKYHWYEGGYLVWTAIILLAIGVAKTRVRSKPVVHAEGNDLHT